MNPLLIKKICEEYNIHLSKKRGQNFLIDQNILDKIIKVAHLTKEDQVLEIGPGLGILTGELFKRAGRVVVVEIDKKLFQILKTKEFNSFVFKNLILLHKDILKVDLAKFFKDFEYKVVANIPYSITSPLLRKLLSVPPRPRELILMVQKEVAERILAAPPKMNLLAIAVQVYGRPRIISKVSRNSFWPKPKVGSAIIKIETAENFGIREFDGEVFWRLVKAGFKSKRKQLINNLSSSFKISKKEAEKFLIEVGLNSKIRAEELSIEDWKKLSKVSDTTKI